MSDKLEKINQVMTKRDLLPVAISSLLIHLDERLWRTNKDGSSWQGE